MAAQDGAERKLGLGTVVAASAAGTAFEWYDFFIFGNLATIIAKHFYTGVSEATGFILALATFAVGFFMRPLGALVFGAFGDMKGRKVAFLITITTMGLATVLIGFLPGYAAIGLWAPIGLVALRVLQGFALGGEYGGAAIYVAEHAPNRKRGGLTSWIQTSAAFGLLAALGVILALRNTLGKDAFEDWGWRIPFVLSSVLLIMSLWIRLRLGESPAFQKMEAEGAARRAPLSETFLKWKNLKYVLLVLFGVMTAQGAVWYQAFFQSQFFMQKILKLDDTVVTEVIAAATAVSAVLYVFFGWLSDKIGRKPVMLFGMFLAFVAYLPITNNSAFHYHDARGQSRPGRGPGAFAGDGVRRPCVLFAAVRPHRQEPVRLLVRHRQGVPDQRRRLLRRSHRARRARRPRFRSARQRSSPRTGEALARAGAQKTLRAGVEGELKAALKTAGYPQKADPNKVDLEALLLIMLVLTVAATALYGPQAAALVELFPDAHSLYRHGRALQHRRRLGRRPVAGRELRHDGGEREHLFRSVVPGGVHRDFDRDSDPVLAGDQGTRPADNHHLRSRRADADPRLGLTAGDVDHGQAVEAAGRAAARPSGPTPDRDRAAGRR